MCAGNISPSLSRTRQRERGHGEQGLQRARGRQAQGAARGAHPSHSPAARGAAGLRGAGPAACHCKGHFPPLGGTVSW